ncbi:MAG TPA: hypothetical protein VH643_08275 [Gemmataceae bacterium]|jgi:predicted Rossmann fold nucleotide-binding protein DprA/Smf involved in DNA uptake
MGRNKLIYALSDAALIVRFTTGEGGTWAGAVEQLSRNKSGSSCVPVFVRLTHNPEDGCEELRRRGATPFPEEEFEKCGVAELLRKTAPSPEPLPAAAEPSGEPQTSAPSPAPSPPPPTQADTCYDRCLPLILQNFRVGVGVKQLAEIAQRLQLRPRQLTDCLKRAIEEGKLAKKKKNGRIVYVAVPARDVQTLFDRDGNSADER